MRLIAALLLTVALTVGCAPAGASELPVPDMTSTVESYVPDVVPTDLEVRAAEIKAEAYVLYDSVTLESCILDFERAWQGLASPDYVPYAWELMLPSEEVPGGLHLYDMMMEEGC